MANTTRTLADYNSDLRQLAANEHELGPVDAKRVILIDPDGNPYIAGAATGTVAVSGTVSVDNFPATQAVSGTVSVGNFPATQAVSGTVDVGNFPDRATGYGTPDSDTIRVAAMIGVGTDAVSSSNRLPVDTGILEAYTRYVYEGSAFIDSASIAGSGGAVFSTGIALTLNTPYKIVFTDTTGEYLAWTVNGSQIMVTAPGTDNSIESLSPNTGNLSVRAVAASAPVTGGGFAVNVYRVSL